MTTKLSDHVRTLWIGISQNTAMDIADEIKELEDKLHKIRDKCLHEIGLDQRKSPFSEGRMDFAEVIWRMIEQEDPPQ